MTVYGYVRVSTKEQNEDRQLLALSAYDICKEHIYQDKQSGKDFARPAYQKLMRRLQPGDLIVVKSIDRLGRNYEEIIEQWRSITKIKRADIFIIDMPLLDTRQKNDLIGTLIADIVLQLLSYVAETERENIKQRQAEGIQAAKLRGVKFGRPALQQPANFEEVYLRWQRGEFNSRKAANLLQVSQSTFLKWAGRVCIEC